MDRSLAPSLHAVVLLLAVCIGAQAKQKIFGDTHVGYDFENFDEMEYIQNPGTTALLDESFAKHGKQSLRWIWKPSSPLIIDMEHQSDIIKEKKVCGLYFWIYQQTARKSSKMSVTVSYEEDKTLSFALNMNFVNWRAVARIFKKPGVKCLQQVKAVTFQVDDDDHFVSGGTLNIDIIRLSTSCNGWSYDFINPPQMSLQNGEKNEIGTQENLRGIYSKKNFWQGGYRYKRLEDHYSAQIDEVSKITLEEDKLVKDLIKISNRVDDWYFPQDMSYEDLDKISKSRYDSLFDCNIDRANATKSFLQWVKKLKAGNFPSLRRRAYYSKDLSEDICVQTAYSKFAEFKDSKKWPSLFPSRDMFPNGVNDEGGKKFNEISRLILFPLSLEYFISSSKGQRKSRVSKGNRSKKDMEDVVSVELMHETKADQTEGQKKEIHKNVKNLQYAKNIFKSYRWIDKIRFKRIKRLFKHMERQGWDENSALGNGDHLINLNNGYTQSVYLLRKNLKEHGLLNKYIRTARWYNDMGELYLDDFKHNGSTADRIKNLMMSRLLIVLATPYSSPKETRTKIHDALKLKKWIENALEINEGFGGIIKPDFTGYHHKGAYMSRYIPKALQALSLVAYFFRGTQFALSQKALSNLKSALKTYHVISNSYAIPHGVSGRHVSYGEPILNHIIPAFGYLSVAMAPTQWSVDSELAASFLKLYKRGNPYLLKDLKNGIPVAGSEYLNSVGAVVVLEKANKLATTGPTSIDETPDLSGNWAKNYAGLSIHRRQDWTVSVKGFSKYVWDFESLIDQNVYGRYQSHGQLQISNNREALDSYDINSGWNWNKVPGTTTVELNHEELASRGKCRYFSGSPFVGGLTMGKKRSKNGIFVMDFKQPQYQDPYFEENPSEFLFKKSFFMIDDMVVSVGSGITKKGLNGKRVMTTLFQNRIRSRSKFFVNNKPHSRDPAQNLKLPAGLQTTLVDINGNGYFIPRSNNDIDIVVGVNRNARQPNDTPVRNLKTFASAVIDHGTSPTDAKYNYAVLVGAGPERMTEFAALFDDPSRTPYTILQQDNVAHVIRVPREDKVITAYSIFDSSKFVGAADGFLHKVSRPVVIMIEEKEDSTAQVAIMDPDLRLFEQFKPNQKFVGEEELYHSYSKPAVTTVYFNQNFEIQSKRNKKESLQSAITNPKQVRLDDGIERTQIQLTLSHGLTSEMKVKKMKMLVPQVNFG